MGSYTRWLHKISLSDAPTVGGKCASLGEMIQNLPSVKVPPGFAVTTEAFEAFLSHNLIDISILTQRDPTTIRSQIIAGTFPSNVRCKIVRKLEKMSSDTLSVAVRSSSTSEDCSEFSGAGQQDTYLNVNLNDPDNVLLHIKKCFASLFNDRAVSYRESMKVTSSPKIAVCIQKMVASESAGVGFSLDPETGFPATVINGCLGLGELLVSGRVHPDEFIVSSGMILRKALGNKTEKIVYATAGTVTVPTELKEKDSFCLTDSQIFELAIAIADIEKYYKHPVDVEWALEKGKLYIVQARPETVHSRKASRTWESTYLEKPAGTVAVLEGIAVGTKNGTGRVRVLRSLSEAGTFQPGEILVTEITTPDFESVMKKASGIITEKGGRTCHAAIISREWGLPCVVGVNGAMSKLTTGQMITISCSEGLTGYVYNGIIPFRTESIALDSLPKVKTALMLNIADPSRAFAYSFLPHQGVGLLRLEFIINQHVKVHPNAILFPDRLTEEERIEINTLTRHSSSGKEYYISELARGIAHIACAFAPHEVIVRFSDFKSSEYRNLLGGRAFEPIEGNPMIGFRGCSRYTSPLFKDAFLMECEAIKEVRKHFPNVVVMLPFCRTVDECKKVLEIMTNAGLSRSENGLRVYLMCELPSNVILAKDFLALVDGFSIGSNDLCQTILATDRDSELVAHLFDERNPAVQKMLKSAVRACHRKQRHKRGGENLVQLHTKKCGICGDSPSTYPEITRMLVKTGIDSLSLSPDVFLKTLNIVAAIEEKKAGREKKKVCRLDRSKRNAKK